MTKPLSELTGSMSECTACGLIFGSVRGFDAHRVGDFAKIGGTCTRRCLTVAELIAGGFAQAEHGVWLTADAKAYQDAKKAMSEPQAATTPAPREGAPQA